MVPMFQRCAASRYLVNGRMRLPDMPGLGVELNPYVSLVHSIAR
ncbi:MAG TPA: hypothetical protein VFP27_10005 [Mycobacterium sp.]|nr:hypothetical protein [Mycobacterium sp.]